MATVHDQSQRLARRTGASGSLNTRANKKRARGGAEPEVPKASRLGKRDDRKKQNTVLDTDVVFVEVGQGDCTAIRSRRHGLNILIDCGRYRSRRRRAVFAPAGATLQPGGLEYREQTNGYNTRIRNELAAVFDGNTIHKMIVTHGDADHNNNLSNVLDGHYTIDKTYVSATLDHNEYGQTQYADCRAWLRNNSNEIFEVDLVHGVRFRQRSSKTTPTVADWQPVPATTYQVNGTGFYRIVDLDDFKVDLLVASLRFDDFADAPWGNILENDHGQNRASIVTLITTANRRILVCGDATARTLEYLHRNFQPQLQNLDVMQVPHHGSQTTSMHPVFYQNARPIRAVVHAAYNLKVNCLPDFLMLRTVADTQPPMAGQRFLSCWRVTSQPRPALPNYAVNGSLYRAQDFRPDGQPRRYTTGQNGQLERIEFQLHRDLWVTGSQGTRRIQVRRNGAVNG